MICPQCESEYGEETAQCPECGVGLVPALPAGDVPEWVEFVTVLVTRDHSELALAKSLLEGAGIVCFAKNEGVENLIAAGPVEVQVRPKDEAEARELLRDLNERTES